MPKRMNKCLVGTKSSLLHHTGDTSETGFKPFSRKSSPSLIRSTVGRTTQASIHHLTKALAMFVRTEKSGFLRLFQQNVAVLLFVTLLIDVRLATASTGADLEEAGPNIPGQVESVRTIEVDWVGCPLVHTLRPVFGNSIQIESAPEGLVTEFQVNRNGVFTLVYDSGTLSGSSSAQVTIQIPVDRPENIIVSGDAIVQIEDGFNAIDLVQTSGRSEVTGYIESSEARRVHVQSSDESTVVLAVGDDTVRSVDQHQNSVESPRVLTVDANGSSSVMLKGDITSVQCDASADCVVEGTIDRLDASSGLDTARDSSSGSVTIPWRANGGSCSGGSGGSTSSNTGNTGGDDSGDDNGDISGASSLLGFSSKSLPRVGYEMLKVVFLFVIGF